MTEKEAMIEAGIIRVDGEKLIVEKELTVCLDGNTFEHKDMIKEKGYSYISGKWSKKVEAGKFLIPSVWTKKSINMTVICGPNKCFFGSNKIETSATCKCCGAKLNNQTERQIGRCHDCT
jgi:hypothetical protein